jgi:rsbT antagonist protein RsbS
MPIQVVNGCVVASVQAELDDGVLEALRQDILACIERNRAHAVALDLSGVEIIDRTDFDRLVSMLEMARLMGARPVLVGMRPGVVSALVDLGVSGDEIETALSLDGAFALLEAAPADECGPDEELELGREAEAHVDRR